MPIETITFNGTLYPAFEKTGYATRFVEPFALEFCKGLYVDVGCSKPEWALKGSIPVDIVFNDGYHGLKLPHEGNLDAIFESNMLEHVTDPVSYLDYWIKCLKPGGVIFTYNPHFSQKYWRIFSNRKHLWQPDQSFYQAYFEDRGMENIFVTPGHDLNNCFVGTCSKPL